MWRSRTCVVGLAFAALATAPIASAIREVDPKDPCKQGGWMRVVGIGYGDPNERGMFRNQGQCVAFVNHGGVLVPMEEIPR